MNSSNLRVVKCRDVAGNLHVDERTCVWCRLDLALAELKAEREVVDEYARIGFWAEFKKDHLHEALILTPPEDREAVGYQKDPGAPNILQIVGGKRARARVAARREA